MAKGTRRNTRKVSGILYYLYKPIGQIFSAANNVTRASTNTVRKVVHNTANGVNRVGRSVTGRANTIVSGLVPNAIKRRFTRKSGRRTKGRKQ
jgi:phage-related protein